MKKIRTRYAPSPTGYFHVGGARSALFCYLFAKHYHGDFIFRIEDTDVERNVEHGIESQYDNLLWLGVIPDESMFNPNAKYEPYIQSKKLSLYQEVANELLNKGLAYRCFCTPDELEQMRKDSLAMHQTPKYSRKCMHLTQEEINEKLNNHVPYVIRLIIPENKNYEWDDMIRGKIVIPSEALTDLVLLKSNGIGSYNFCNVIDDHDMQITHIIRGEEHISNTPYQLAIIDALKQLPRYINTKEDFNFTYGHLPVVVNTNGKKLSKRDTSLKQFIGDYKEMGFLPMAIDNFLVNLGWSAPNNQEYFSNLQEIIAMFDGSRISKSPGIFDFKKMVYLNKKHLDALSDEEYLKAVKPFVKEDLKELGNKEDEVLLLFRKDLKVLGEINGFLHELLNPTPCEMTDEIKQVMQNAKEHHLFTSASEQLQAISEFNNDNISNWLKNLGTTCNLKGKDLYLPLRFSLFHQLHGPEFVKLVHLFGKQYCLDQLNMQIDHQ